jgi:hypothetical protein
MLPKALLEILVTLTKALPTKALLPTKAVLEMVVILTKAVPKDTSDIN